MDSGGRKMTKEAYRMPRNMEEEHQKSRESKGKPWNPMEHQRKDSEKEGRFWKEGRTWNVVEYLGISWKKALHRLM